MRIARVINDKIEILNTATEIPREKWVEKSLYEIQRVENKVTDQNLVKPVELIFKDGIVQEVYTIFEKVLTLQEKKIAKLEEIKTKALIHIQNNFSIDKQLEAALGILTTEEKTNLVNFIKATKAQAKTYIDRVNSGDINFEVVY